MNTTGIKNIFIIAIIGWIICLVMFALSSQKTLAAEQPSLTPVQIASNTPVPQASKPVATPTTTNIVEPLKTETEPKVVAQTPTKPDYITYTVKSGDSLWKISSIYYGNGALYTKIMQSNNLTSDTINIGQQLKIYDIDKLPAVAEVETKQSTSDKENLTYIGNYRITGYDPYCSHCCGKVTGITASGRKAEIGYSVGCNNLPLGTKLYIEGYGYYRVDDKGGSSTNLIDIACSSHEACYQVTNYNIPVYIVNE